MTVKLVPPGPILQAIAVRVEQIWSYACAVAVLARLRTATWHRGAKNYIVARDAAGRGYRDWRGPPREGLFVYHGRTLSGGCVANDKRAIRRKAARFIFREGELHYKKAIRGVDGKKVKLGVVLPSSTLTNNCILHNNYCRLRC